MTSQPGKQIIEIYILPNISTSKDNQTMKFAQLIECDMRNIFVFQLSMYCLGISCHFILNVL